MRTCLLGVFFILSSLCNAQDFEFPDYRSKREVFKTILEKDVRADIASFSFGGLDESIGKLPLKTIPIAAAGKDFITFASSDVQVTIKSTAFDPAKHKLGYYDNKYLVKINNKAYFGDYGKVPKTSIESLTVVVDGDTVAIPPVAYTDLYNPVLSITEGGVQKSSNKIFRSNDGRKIYIYMLKQEVGGSYETTWVIQDKKYLRRVVDFGFLK